MTDPVYAQKSRKGLFAIIAVIIAALVAAYVLFAGGDDSDEAAADGPNAGQTINIVGFAVPEAANKAIAAEYNKTEDGAGVKFKTSYGASGDQSRAVEGGLKADYVHFSVGTDVDRLVKAGLIDEIWDDGDNKGVVSSSIVVLGVREGNPKNIQGWDDLIKPGVGIVTANPEQIGSPDDLYDRPASEFVLSFLGPVTRFGGDLLRPHDIDITRYEQAATTNGPITRWTRVGFEIRLEVTPVDTAHPPVQVTLTRTEANSLGLHLGDHVWLRPAEGAQHVSV